MSVADTTRTNPLALIEAQQEIALWRALFGLVSMVMLVISVVLVSVADDLDRAIAERNEARAVAVEMWPDWIRLHEPRPWAYILPCPKGDMEIKGLDWMPTTEQP